eukprot:scaffold9699_cov38-Prasinocladus_malaysianus.AAC.1
MGSTVSGARRGSATGVLYPFRVDDDDDHCETSPEAYGDIEGMLGQLAKLMNKQRSELAIYDPYYCTGQVVSNLGERTNADWFHFSGCISDITCSAHCRTSMPKA